MPPKNQKIASRVYYVELYDARYKTAMKTDEMSYQEAKAIYDKLHPGRGCRLYLKETAYDEYGVVVFIDEDIDYKDGE